MFSDPFCAFECRLKGTRFAGGCALKEASYTRVTIK
jgi:hypothetical protein